jgi:hypothetical protein
MKCLLLIWFFLIAAEIRKQRLIEKYKNLKVPTFLYQDVQNILLGVLLGSYGSGINIIRSFLCDQESGKLESFVEQRRKKNATKDHRYLPYRRPDHPE